MPPKKFMTSSKISDVWKDSVPPAQKKRKKEADEDDIDLRVTSEHLRALLQQRGVVKSERSALAQELSDVKKLKGSNQAKALNYAELQKKQKKLKELEQEQAERDKELGGGSAIIKRSKSGKKKEKKASLREIGMKDGAVVVSKRKIQSHNSKKSKIVL